MSEIATILQQLESTSSRNEKVEILQQNQDNDLLQRFFSLCLNPFINFFIKKIPSYSSRKTSAMTLNEVFDSLDDLIYRRRTGNAGITFLTEIFEALNSTDGDILARVIARDPKCGVDIKTVNKVWTNLIPTFDVCLANKDISGIVFPAIAQVKMDGVRCHVHFDGKVATAMSRSGKPFNLHNMLDKSAQMFMMSGETFDGELLFFDGAKVLDRKTSNGLANKAIKGTLTPEEAANVVFFLWDIVDTSSSIPYSKRFKTLLQRFAKVNEDCRFKLVEWESVNTNEEAAIFFEKCLAAGQEGAIIKNLDMKWEPKRVKGMGKMKSEEEADLLVVDWIEGTGKYAGMLGALRCRTSDAKLEVNVGSGFSDQQRKDFTRKEMLGKIVTVRYNQIVDDVNRPETKSLFLPRFVEVRFDKKEPNKIIDLK